MLTDTRNRVPQNTARAINQQIRQQTEFNVLRYSSAGSKAIDRRLAELDQEWDIERCLETMSSTLTLVGLTLGITKARKWLVLPLAVQSFFLQHALQGWCPPLPLLRRLGIRTADEINQERYALKALRGDFENVATDSESLADHRVVEALAATRN